MQLKAQSMQFNLSPNLSHAEHLDPGAWGGQYISMVLRLNWASRPNRIASGLCPISRAPEVLGGSNFHSFWSMALDIQKYYF